MVIRRYFLFLIVLVLLGQGCGNDDPDAGQLELAKVFMGNTEISLSGTVTGDIPVDRSITLNFSAPVERSSALQAVSLKSDGVDTPFDLNFTSEDKTLTIFPKSALKSSTTYTVTLAESLRGASGQAFSRREFSFKTATVAITVTSLKAGSAELLSFTAAPQDVAANSTITIKTSGPLNINLMTNTTVTLKDADGNQVNASFVSSPESNTVIMTPASKLRSLVKYQLTLTNAIKGVNAEPFNPVTASFYSGVNADPVMPAILNDEDNDADNTNDLLSVVQQQTFKYFWDFAHPTSGMARERNTSGDIVTSGGSGFGIMALIVGMERNFISHSQGIERMQKIVSFLESADRFHGAWSHWINGATGAAIAFSTKDNGGDLVETSFLVQGLITFRQYLNPAVPEESDLIDRITTLYNDVEWDWYRKNNEEVLYWHWSPDYNWEMNFALSGYFEEQITYVLAASSSTHAIPKSVYTNGYAKNGAIVKNNTYYGYTLPLESPAPLFWVQYSYLGLDPHFSDGYANYWTQNVNATMINQAYCIANPKKYVGYSDRCWGLTSSDNQSGYDAHSPSNDKGVITPTAALSSFPYTPEESMKALKFFYYTLGDRLWGEYGFYDAFNLTESWTASSYLAIDQGPIIVMIENYRSGLLWDLFMSAPEIQNGTSTLDFTN